jgi:hypothetical protein
MTRKEVETKSKTKPTNTDLEETQNCSDVCVPSTVYILPEWKMEPAQESNMQSCIGLLYYSMCKLSMSLGDGYRLCTLLCTSFCAGM